MDNLQTHNFCVHDQKNGQNLWKRKITNVNNYYSSVFSQKSKFHSFRKTKNILDVIFALIKWTICKHTFYMFMTSGSLMKQNSKGKWRWNIKAHKLVFQSQWGGKVWLYSSLYRVSIRFHSTGATYQWNFCK